jgi:predicted dehydrogenase
LGAHLIDQALHLFGLPDSVQGDVFAQRENGVVDDWNREPFLLSEKYSCCLEGGLDSDHG